MKRKTLNLLLTLLVSSTFAQTTIELVADINNTPKDSDIEKGVVHNGKYYFGAPTVSGEYLHVYDGTFGVAPTLAPGVVGTGASNEAGKNPEGLVIFNGKMYFQGYLSWKGNELMEYDFATAPRMVHDIYSNGQASSQPEHLTVYNNKLYFVATELDNGRELWVYDGTNTPSLAADINPGSGSSSPNNLTVYNGKLYFVATDVDQDIELYEFDGINPPKKYNVNAQTTGSSNTISSKPQFLTVCNDTLYFRAKGTDNIQDLYEFTSTDSFQLAYVWSGSRRHIYPSSLASFNNKLYFNGIPQWGTYNLLEFDGHNTPTVVHEINGAGKASSPVEMTVAGTELFFRAFTTANGWELYRYNGVDTPKLVQDMMPGNASSIPQKFVDFNGNLIYTATDPTYGTELRVLQTGSKTSGIPDLIADYSPGNESSWPFHFIEYNDKMYFGATSGDAGRELWEYDGTNPPTMVVDYKPGTGHSMASNHAHPIIYKGKMLYLAEKFSGGEIVSFDGDTILPIAPMYAEGFRTIVTSMIEFQGNIYFDGFKFDKRRELYKYDGDTITLLADINPTGDGNPGSFFIYKDKLYFSADNGVKGAELWVYDGTNPPTMAAEINEGGNSYPHSFQELNGKLYFLANNGTDTKIFEYDAVSAPKQIEQGELRAHQYLTKHDDKLYFSAWDGSNQPEMYEYDGTNAPALIADINPGSIGSNPRDFTSYHGKLYFKANNPSVGYEMWTYDGTDTTAIDHFQGTNGLEPSSMYIFKEKLYFNGRTEDNGYELFSLEAPKKIETNQVKEITQSVKLYPNPSNNVVTVQLNEPVTKVTFYSTSGREVMSVNNTSTLNISTLATGIYVVLIESANTIGYSRLIKD